MLSLWSVVSWFCHRRNYNKRNNRILLNEDLVGTANLFLNAKVQSSFVTCETHIFNTSFANLPSVVLYILYNSSNFQYFYVSLFTFLISIFSVFCWQAFHFWLELHTTYVDKYKWHTPQDHQCHNLSVLYTLCVNFD